MKDSNLVENLELAQVAFHKCSITLFIVGTAKHRRTSLQGELVTHVFCRVSFLCFSIPNRLTEVNVSRLCSLCYNATVSGA